MSDYENILEGVDTALMRAYDREERRATAAEAERDALQVWVDRAIKALRDMEHEAVVGIEQQSLIAGLARVRRMLEDDDA